ncbi:MAG: DUF4199 domain-containing protein [Bacteroidetes bacterium]|nr:DUF4199 domain-containing protein [Bacteroidota bacterium]
MQQTAVKYGIITGMAMALYLFVFYKINRELALNPMVVWGTLFFAVGAMVLAVRKIRRANDGEISKQEALKNAFLVFVLTQLVFWLFIFVLFNLIDPGLIDLQQKMMLDAGVKVENQDLRMTFGRVFFRFAFMLLPGFFFSLMVASFMKK